MNSAEDFLVENEEAAKNPIAEEENPQSQFCPFEQKAMDSYDEDLSENPFFQSLLASCPELFSQCVLEQWLICIPRRDSLPKYAFTLEDFTHHVLRPQSRKTSRHWSGGSTCSSGGSISSLLPPLSSVGSYYSEDQSLSFLSNNKAFENEAEEGTQSASTLKGNWNYQTLTHINVELTGRTLILDVEVPIRGLENNNQENAEHGFVQLRKEILFDETFYTNDRRKYKVLCIASPLNSKVDIEDEGFGNAGLGLWNLTSLRDCIDFIWVKGNFKVLETYDMYIKLFLHNHPALENLPLLIQKNLVNTLYLKCLEYSEGTGMTTIPDNHSLSDFILRKLQLATETYILNGVYRSLISAITSVTAAEDAFINKITRNLFEIHPQDMDIGTSYWNVLGKARHELSRINSYSTPLGKLSCMKRTIRHLRTNSVPDGGDASVLCTDELIPIWVYLLVKNPLGNWVAQLEFLRNFRFSSIDQPDNEDSFYIVTLEASLEHLKSGKVLGISECERDIGSPSELGEAWLYALHQEAYESDNPRLAEMFELIRLGNCIKLEEMIEEYEVERYEHNKKLKQPKEIDASLFCHPLCHCVNCSALYQTASEDQPIIPAVDLATKDGLTMLHVACIYGRPKVVDFLIGAGSNLESCDSQGMRAIHFAASRGHQNAVLLLLHAGCDLEPLNAAQNRPIHLSAQNGHEGCVKALIYYAEHIGKNIHLSAGNAKGDTPLHYASRWGFIGIVNILTEHGAAITIPNVRHVTPIDCAHDIHILKILQRSMRRRSLVQTNHGDFVNIEMMLNEDSGRTYMLISEPAEPPLTPTHMAVDLLKNMDQLAVNSKPNSRSTSRVSSRRSSFSNLLSPTNAFPPASRSRKVSSICNPAIDNCNPKISEQETEKCLRSVVDHLVIDSSVFIVPYYEDYDPTEQEHVRKISIENLNLSDEVLETEEIKRDRDILKLFSSITVGDIPLTLFYLGIPAEETDNPENESECINVLSPCHPLCPCHRCLTRSSGLGLDLDIKNVEGLSPLHMAVQFHVLILVKILLRYGADINCQSTYEKKTPLDYSIERGFHDIESILLASGAMTSTSFCQASPDECEK